VGAWESPVAVASLEDFEVGLDSLLQELAFSGTDVFLILEHEQFVHQAELVPPFSESAARAYLRGRVQRYEQEREPMLWVGQRTVSVRKESGYLLHLLPTAFYSRLSSALLTRRLDLTRILPAVVPLQLMLESAAAAKEQMVLVAAEAGAATTLMVARGDGELLFSRTMLARWETDAARIAVEVNRSLLYAKQQFGAVVDRIELLGSVSDQARADVQARCGPEKKLIVRPTHVSGWLQAVARLSARHPVNLVVGYLGRKRRRQFLRKALLAACWMGLLLMALDFWTDKQTWIQKERELQRLRSHEPELTAERDRLRQRNNQIGRNREIVRVSEEGRVPSVAARFLTYVARVRTPDTQLTDLSAKLDPETGKWIFRLEGRIEGDQETARESLAALQRSLEKSPLHARFNEAMRVITLLPSVVTEATPIHRFAVEGGLFED